MPGGKSVFPTLTVAENLRLSAWMIRDDKAQIEERNGRDLRPVPDPRPALGPDGGRPLRRRAADALARRRADDPAPDVDDRRAVPRACAHDRRPAHRSRSRDPPPRHHDRGGRAVGERRPAARRAGRVHGEGRGALRGPRGRAAGAARHPALRVHRRRVEGPARRRRRADDGAAKSEIAASGRVAGGAGRATRARARRARDHRGHQALRRHHRRRPGRHRPARGRDPRAHRPQRCRQDHADGLRLRLPRDRRRAGAPPGLRRHRAGAPRAGRRRPRAFVPGRIALPDAHRGRDDRRRPRAPPRVTRHGGRRVPAARRRTSRSSRWPRRSRS